MFSLQLSYYFRLLSNVKVKSIHKRVLFSIFLWNGIVNAVALAEKLEQSSETNAENLKLLKEAIINCRQNEAYLRVIHVNNTICVR